MTACKSGLQNLESCGTRRESFGGHMDRWPQYYYMVWVLRSFCSRGWVNDSSQYWNEPLNHNSSADERCECKSSYLTGYLALLLNRAWSSYAPSLGKATTNTIQGLSSSIRLEVTMKRTWYMQIWLIQLVFPPPPELPSLYCLMPRRMTAVITVEGGATKY